MTRGHKASIGDTSIVNGYLCVKVGENRWEFKHRLVMEEFLGRPLQNNEYVKFKDGNKENVVIDNLMVLVKNGNKQKEIAKLEAKIAELQDRVQRLRNETT